MINVDFTYTVFNEWDFPIERMNLIYLRQKRQTLKRIVKHKITEFGFLPLKLQIENSG